MHVCQLEGETGEDEERESRLFPDPEEGGTVAITAAALTGDCLSYATDGGALCCFLIEDWQAMGPYRYCLIETVL